VWCSQKVEIPLLGVITGAGWRQDGVYHPGFGGGWDTDPEPPSWECRRVHQVWLVRFTVTGHEFPCFAEGLQPVDTGAAPVPWR
jgi:hypothetical protein